MFFRVVTTTVLLGTTVVVQFREVGGVTDAALSALYVLIGFIYFLSFIYAVILPKWTSARVQAYIQISGDILTTTAVIFLTGGLESAFSFMYILAVINAGILLRSRGAFITASLCAILYGSLLDLHYYGYISPYMTRLSFFHIYRATDILNTILVNMGAFYLVAFLIGYLAKQAEESRIKLVQQQSDLERLEDISENIIQSIDSGLMTLGPNGEILSFNLAAELITGFRFDNIKGLTYTIVFPGLEFPEKSDTTPDQPLFWNWTYRSRHGREMFLDFHLLDLRDRSGANLGRLLVFQDRTHIRQMEEEVKRVERLATIGQLAAGIAHEIRNPLASMSGSIQMLEEELTGSEYHKRLLSIVRREMERLNHIVTDFLMFARPSPNRRLSMDLSRAVDDNLKMFELQAGLDARIRIEKKIMPDVWVMFDQNQLEQVMWNLLNNAAEAIEGGGRITVDVSMNEDPVPMATVAVTDSGSGIAPEDLQRLYDPFFTTKTGGSGLGLSIVYRIIQSGGGRIDVSSAPGLGTTFTIFIPLASSPL